MIKNNMILGFDMDGVILDHTGLKIALAKNLGFDLAPHETHSEVIGTILPEEHLNSLQFSLYHDPDICFATFVMRGIEPILKNLQQKHISYYLVSRRRTPETAIAVLQEKGFWPHYFDEKNSFFVATPEDKNARARALGITHYVDDEPKVLNLLVDVPHRFLFDQYGIFPVLSQYTNVRSWQEFQNYTA